MASSAARRLPLRPRLSTRAFSTTLSRSSSLHIEKNDRELVAETVPAYPYGPRQWYKQSNQGLYGVTQLQFGNNIGPKFKTKTRRTWHPNIMRKRLWSHALGRSVQIKVQARVLRTIDKVGGLDEYLLGDKEGRIKELGVTGWWLRWAIMQTPHIRRRFLEEREVLGIAEPRIEKPVEEPGIEHLGEPLETAPEGEAQLASEAQVASEDHTYHTPITTRRSATFRQARLLKFRVDKGAHFVFTSKGWRRAVPDPRVRGRRKVLLRSPALRQFAVNTMQKLDSPPAEEIELVRPAQAVSSREGEPVRIENTTSIMQQVLQEHGTDLTPQEEKAVRKAVAKALRAKQERLVEKRVDRPDKMAAERKLKNAKATSARRLQKQLARDKRLEERMEKLKAARMPQLRSPNTVLRASKRRHQSPAAPNTPTTPANINGTPVFLPTPPVDVDIGVAVSVLMQPGVYVVVVKSYADVGQSAPQDDDEPPSGVESDMMIVPIVLGMRNDEDVEAEVAAAMKVLRARRCVLLEKPSCYFGSIS